MWYLLALSTTSIKFTSGVV